MHYFRQGNIGVHVDHSPYISQSAVVSVCYGRDVLRYVHNLSESNDVLDLLSSGSLLSWSPTRSARNDGGWMERLSHERFLGVGNCTTDAKGNQERPR